MMTLDGSCRCGAVRFSMRSHAPQPYQLCYCTICRKTAGGGGYAINLMGEAATLAALGREATSIYHAQIEEPEAGAGDSAQRLSGSVGREPGRIDAVEYVR